MHAPTPRSTLDFPREKPREYIRLKDEPPFAPSRHLALTSPQNTVSLQALGYDEDDIANCPSPVALTSAFRVFSDEGLAVVRALAEEMKSNRNAATGTGDARLGSYIRGAGYRSRFIRDFCDCREWLDFLSALVGTPLGRHSLPSVACGINYAPEDVTRAIDTWHVDSVSFDAVILLTDPQTFEGGEFQYFQGTKAEGEALLGVSGESGTLAELPAGRVHDVCFPAAGCGFLQQGNKVFHRARRLARPAQRTTLLPSFAVLASDKEEGSNVAAMRRWNDPGMLAELARHEAWLARDKLQRLIESLPLTATAQDIAAQTENAVDGVNRLAALLRDGDGAA